MWQKVLLLLKEEIPIVHYGQYIECLNVQPNTKTEIVLECPSKIVKTKIEDKYLKLIKEKIKIVAKQNLNVRLILAESPNEKKPTTLDFSVNYHNENSLIETELSNKYIFRYDVVFNNIEYKEKNSQADFRTLEINGREFNDIYRELSRNPRFKYVKAQSLAISLNSSFVKEYNPLTDYIKSLKGKWKRGDHNYLGEMINCFKFTNKINAEYYFKKWYMQAIHSAFTPNFINAYCFVLHSSRGGKGKTIFCDNFLPKAINDRFRNSSTTFEFKSRDSLILASQVFIWNMDELESIVRNRTEADELRNFISNTGALTRKAFGKEAKRYYHLASFMATCNVDEPYYDTENRRFITFTVEEKMLFEKFFEIDKEMVMAQVYNEYLRLGEKGILFTQSEEDEITDNARQYEKNHNEYDLLFKHFEPCGSKESDDTQWLSCSEVLEFIKENHPKIYVTTNGIGRALFRAGFSKNRDTAFKTYLVKFKSKEAKKFFQADQADQADL